MNEDLVHICARVCIAALLVGNVCALEGPATRYQIPHGNVYGSQVTDTACKNRNVQGDLSNAIQGTFMPYAFVGPSSSCTATACENEYWMSRCRWDAKNEPACPLQARQDLVSRLARQAQQGSDWVLDALSIKPCDLWPLIKGRTVWVIGDSISQDYAVNLDCFLIEYMVPEHTGKNISDDEEVMTALTKSPSGKEMRTWCLHFESKTRICNLRANKITRLTEVILKTLPKIADREEDIVIMNVGAWYNYIDGMAELHHDMIKFEAGFNKLRSQLPKRIIWRESTAQHFNTTSGMFDGAVSIGDQRCAPAGAKMGVQLGLDTQRNLVHTPHHLSDDYELKVMLRGGHRNTAIQPVIDRLGIETLFIWNLSLVEGGFHNNYHRPDSNGHCVYIECDCSHACSPSWFALLLPDLKAILEKNWDGKDTTWWPSTGYNRTLDVS